MSRSASDSPSVEELRERVSALEAELEAIRRPELGRSLSEREALLAEAEQIAQVGSWTWDPSTGEVVWSDECFRVLGYDPVQDTPSVEAFFAAIHPADLERIQQEAEIAAKKGEARPSDARVIHRADGSIHHVLFSSRSVPRGADLAPRLVGTVQDITARKTAAETIARTARELEEAQRVASVGSWSWGPRTGTNTWSKELYRILRVDLETDPSPDFVLGLVHPDDRHKFVALSETASQTAGDYELDCRMIRPDGSQIHASIATRVAERDAQGAPTRYIGTLMDVTRRRQLEDQLRHAQRMEAIGTFAGGVAHDFNNYLQITLGNLELLELDLPTGSSSRAAIAEIRQASEACHQLTQRLLAFGRKRNQRPEVVDIDDLATNTHRLLERMVGEHIRVDAVLKGGGMKVQVDPAELQQVLVNLVANARDAMESGGIISLRTYPDHREDTAAHAVIEVSDQGSGIPEELLTRVFDPFFTTKDEGRGTGLGLSVVYGIVTGAGGQIKIDRLEPQGTRFRITLPLTEREQKATPERPRPKEKPVRGLILVVDDQAQVRRLATAQLERAGYRVLVAANGAEGISLVRECAGQIDLILSDVLMPQMNGPEMIREVRKSAPQIPVVFMSGYTDELPPDLGTGDGSIRLLEKPFDYSTLLQAVGVALDPAHGTTQALNAGSGDAA